MSTERSRQLGQHGEEIAAAHLEAAGYEIIDRNVRPDGTGGPGDRAYAEIDIIAREGGDIVFVEVKTRDGADYGNGAEALHPAKIRALARGAQAWLDARGWGDSMPCRCDVVDINERADDGRERIIVYRDALPLWEYLT